MKKKAVVSSAVLCFIIVAVAYFSLPSPLLNNTDDVQIYQVRVANSEYKYEDITDQVDCIKLAQIISAYTRSKLPHSFAPYQITVGDIEINGTAGNKSMHILLGDVDVIYESANKGGYTIYNSEQLVSDVLQMIQ